MDAYVCVPRDVCVCLHMCVPRDVCVCAQCVCVCVCVCVCAHSVGGSVSVRACTPQHGRGTRGHRDVCVCVCVCTPWAGLSLSGPAPPSMAVVPGGTGQACCAPCSYGGCTCGQHPIRGGSDSIRDLRTSAPTRV